MKISVLAWHYKSFKKQNKVFLLNQGKKNNTVNLFFSPQWLSVLLRLLFFIWLNKRGKERNLTVLSGMLEPTRCLFSSLPACVLQNAFQSPARARGPHTPAPGCCPHALGLKGFALYLHSSSRAQTFLLGHLLPLLLMLPSHLHKSSLKYLLLKFLSILKGGL